MTDLLVKEVPVSRIGEISGISPAFVIRTVLEIVPSGKNQGEWLIEEHLLDQPLVKDYDAISENHPLDWAKQFDIRNWGLLFAYAEDVLIGSALIAYKTPGVDILEDRTDQAVLWDIRVTRTWRGKGVGKELFVEVKTWAKDRNCRELKIETQTNNSAAVRFYFRQGCCLKRMIPDAYPDLPEEVQLLFYLPL